MDTTGDVEQVVKKYPIMTTKQQPSAAAPIETDTPSHIYAVPVVMTIPKIEIVTISPTKKEKTPFQPVTITVLPSAKVPASLLSIYVPMQPSPVKTDCIIPSVYIVVPDFSNAMCGGYP